MLIDVISAVAMIDLLHACRACLKETPVTQIVVNINVPDQPSGSEWV